MKGGEGRRQGILTLKPHCPFCAKGFDWKSCNSHSGVTSAVREIGAGGRARERGEINNITRCRFSCLLVHAASYGYGPQAASNAYLGPEKLYIVHGTDSGTSI